MNNSCLESVMKFWLLNIQFTILINVCRTHYWRGPRSGVVMALSIQLLHHPRLYFFLPFGSNG